MEVILFIFYLILFSYFISIIPFFRTPYIATSKIIILFLIKVVAGIAYARFYTLPRYSAGSDTWRYYRLSIPESEWLLKNPLAFLVDLFVYKYDRSGNLFSGENSYWNDLKSNIIIKLMALINVFTFKSYYANIIIFNFLFLFGLVALFKTFINNFPSKKNYIIAGIFLLPSSLFWCSGIHKDGLILSAIGIIIYYFYNGLKTTFTAKRLLAIILCLLLIFSLRNYVALALLPALLCWWFSEKNPSKSAVIFLTVYTLGLIAFFVLPKILPSINFPLFLSQKQNEFLQLNGTSSITATSLQPSLESFLSYLPIALDVAFLRPHIAETKNFNYIPAALEIIMLMILIVLFIIFTNKKQLSPPIILFFLFFSFSIMFISGYTITFSGAIVRYRSFVLPLLVTPLICILNFSSIRKKLLPVAKNLR